MKPLDQCRREVGDSYAFRLHTGKMPREVVGRYIDWRREWWAEQHTWNETNKALIERRRLWDAQQQRQNADGNKQ